MDHRFDDTLDFADDGWQCVDGRREGVGGGHKCAPILYEKICVCVIACGSVLVTRESALITGVSVLMTGGCVPNTPCRVLFTAAAMPHVLNT